VQAIDSDQGAGFKDVLIRVEEKPAAVPSSRR
jgi:hypothetical protein